MRVNSTSQVIVIVFKLNKIISTNGHRCGVIVWAKAFAFGAIVVLISIDSFISWFNAHKPFFV